MQRWKAFVAVPALLAASLVSTNTGMTPARGDDCAKRYVASGDGVVAGTDVENSLVPDRISGSDGKVPYPQKLLDYHLKTIPGGVGSAPWCLYNTATDPATTTTFITGSGSQQSQANTLKPSLVTLQLGRQNATIVDQVSKCYDDIKNYNLLPAAAVCAKDVLDDTASYTKLTKDLGGILNAYKVQMAGNPNLVVAVLGYYNPYPPVTKVLKVIRLCARLIDSAVPCGLYWGLSLPFLLTRLDQAVRKLNDTIAAVVKQFTTASQGRFFFVNPYDAFKRHCMQWNVFLSTPLVLHPPAVLDSHSSYGLMGCLDNWVAQDGHPGTSPVVYLWPVAPPGIPLLPPFHITEGMGINPNMQGHGCLADLVWETVKNKLGVPEKPDVAHACSYLSHEPSDPPPADLPPPIPTNPNPVPPASSIVQGHVAVGSLHTCAVLASGAVNCWGNNDDGQLGNGTTIGGSTPVTVSGLTNATQVSAGGNHSCALRSDGTVWCWGSDGSGELGDGGTADHSTPVQSSGLTGATAIAAGHAFTCALVSGLVKCWGDDSGGQIGDGTPGDSTKVPTAVRGITNAIAIAAGDYHACAILADKTVTCWGNNDDGQLGDRTFTERLAPVQVAGLPDPTVNPPVALTAGSGHTCVLLQDNSARCWGDNTSGQLGYVTPDADGDQVMDPSPVPNAVQYDSDAGAGENLQPLYGLTSISAGQFHTCGLMTDGTGRCWGSNGGSQLGQPEPPQSDETGHSAAIPVSGLSGASGLVAGGAHSCAVVGTDVRCWGYDSDDQLGHTNASSRAPVKVKAVVGASTVSAGSGFVCALVDSGKPVCWGDNAAGQLGSGPPPADSQNPITVAGIPAADAIDAGNGHACAVVGTDIRCWGRNDDGQLGPASAAGGISAGGGRDTNGDEHGQSCAVRPNSTVACWGANGDGQLGNGNTTSSATPTTVQVDTDPDPNAVSLADLTGVRSVSTGGFHTCAVRTDSTVWCWGRNDHGQLGDGTVAGQTVATEVQTVDPATSQLTPLTGAALVAAGLRSTCAAMTGSGVKCWGAADHGQLGNGTLLEQHLPVAVGGLGSQRVTTITAGDVHMCALLDDDSVLCWGGNNSGQLGDGSITDRSSPALIIAPPQSGSSIPADARPIVKSITAGRSNTCIAQGEDAAVYCWGDNAHGQLNDGVGNSSATPLLVDLAGPV